MVNKKERLDSKKEMTNERIFPYVLGCLNSHDILAFVINTTSLDLLWSNESTTKNPVLFEQIVRSLFISEQEKLRHELKHNAGLIKLQTLNNQSGLAAFLHLDINELEETKLCFTLNLGTCLKQEEHLEFIEDYCLQALSELQYKSLTDKQKQVLDLILKNQSRKSIAEKLKLSVYTVQDHNKALFKKFRCKSLSQLKNATRFLTIENKYPK